MSDKNVSLTRNRRPDKAAIKRAHRLRRETLSNLVNRKSKKR